MIRKKIPVALSFLAGFKLCFDSSHRLDCSKDAGVSCGWLVVRMLDLAIAIYYCQWLSQRLIRLYSYSYMCNLNIAEENCNDFNQRNRQFNFS